MDETLEARLDALERAITDGEHDLSALAAEGDALERLETLDSRLADVDDRVSELEAASQALRGYVGNIRSVNTDVEKRAAAALAKVESLEETIDSAGRSFDQQSIDSTRRQASNTGSEARNGTGTERSTRDNPTGETEPTASESSPNGVNSRQEPSARSNAVQPERSHCRACGKPSRLHGSTRGGGGSEDDGLPDEQSQTRNGSGGPITPEQPGDEGQLIPEPAGPRPEDASDAGTLQRIRNML